MLARPLFRSVAAAAARPSLASRCLSTTAARLDKPKAAPAPSIGDISPSRQCVDDFNAKQQAFREKLATELEKREKEEVAKMQAAAAAAVESAEPATPTGPQGLGSLSTASGEPGRKPGLMTNLIYGTKEGREHDAIMEASFSAKIARGKYVHSIVYHQVEPKHVDEYVSLIGEWYPKMAQSKELNVHLVGSWRTEIGDCDTFIHVWEYPRYQGYHEALYASTHHQEFSNFERKVRQLISGKRSSLMQEFSFWPTSPPRHLGGIFELRSYTLAPGNLLQWEQQWRRGLKARREVMEGVGAWYCQIGDLNTVHHLWQFANLEERKRRREKSWSVEGWGETVHNTLPMIQKMQSRIMVAMPWSPVS
jgi:hypothetical protein